MSKPKPGLGKGLARTLVHPAPTAPSAAIHHPIALPPLTEFGRRSYVTAASPLRASVDISTPTPSSSSYSFPQLLTHYCEEEVARWWAGADDYMTSDDDASGWAARAWKRGAESEAGGATAVRKHRRPLDPVEIMQKGYEKCLSCAATEGIYGSSTCLLALLHHSTLLVANLGDCSLLVIRRGEVVFRTSEMQHAFNFPLQLGTHSRDEPMKDAKRYDFTVEKEDVVIVGSDGLMDNLFDEDILETLQEFSSPSQPSSLPPFSPQVVSEELCNRARAVSEQTTATTPFMIRAIEEGIDFVGGKRDDISVLVGVIGDRDGSNLTLDTGVV
ncbi:hypothetical protein Q8F55_005714 [Vanrija albida]|uniref:Protein phosphatase n=1 Tax=Vanrija albida TaxID=181172 RepID=A0ABR3Q2D0_9TREE